MLRSRQCQPSSVLGREVKISRKKLCCNDIFYPQNSVLDLANLWAFITALEANIPCITAGNCLDIREQGVGNVHLVVVKRCRPQPVCPPEITRVHGQGKARGYLFTVHLRFSDICSQWQMCIDITETQKALGTPEMVTDNRK